MRTKDFEGANLEDRIMTTSQRIAHDAITAPGRYTLLISNARRTWLAEAYRARQSGKAALPAL